MAPRGQKGSAGASSTKEASVGPNGPIEEWLSKMDTLAQAHKETIPLRRPGKEIVGDKVVGPDGLGRKENPLSRGKENAGSVGLADTKQNQARVSEKQVTGNSDSHPQRPARGAGSENTKSKNVNGRPGIAPSKGSWADKVRASSAKSRFSLDSDLAQEHGQSVYSLPDEFIDEDFGDWTRCLVGFIPGSSFPFYAARSIALREWKSYGIETVFAYEGFFIFRFPNEEKAQEVLADGPWLFGGKYMMLQQWHACFVFDKNKISKVPVWVKLKGLPFTLWTLKALSFVAGIVGKPLACDRATHERSRLSYARVCIEVDANRPYVHNFALSCKLSSDPIRIGVEYEWKPQRCKKCCVYGHNCEVRKVVGDPATSELLKENSQDAMPSVVGVGISPLGVNLEAAEQVALSNVGPNSEDQDKDIVLKSATKIGEASLPCANKLRGIVVGSVTNSSSSLALPIVEAVPQEKLKGNVVGSVTNSPSSIALPIIEAVPQELNREDDMASSIEPWEQRELNSLALIPSDMDSLGFFSEDGLLAVQNEDGVLMVEPILAVGGAEGVCNLNKRDSLGYSKNTTPGKRGVAGGKEKVHLDLEGYMTDSAHSVRPLRPRRKGKQRKGASPFS